MELVIPDVVEQILERLPPKFLLRFKSVSKQWKSIIESPFFQYKHLNRQKSKNPDLLMINPDYEVTTLELKSSISRNIPIPWENNLDLFCQNSIDGLICLYNFCDSVVIFNPATRWYRTLPPSFYHQKKNPNSYKLNHLGFGKDEINGLYKPVWLYNSSELSENNNATTTTCEVFDFKINAWRFVESSSPKRIRDWDDPVYANGLLYWLTEEEEEEMRSVLSFDLHTETFEIVCEIPVSDMVIFNLCDNLCGSSRFDCCNVIWLWSKVEKTWKKTFFMDSYWICKDFEDCMCEVRPLAFVKEKKKTLLLCDYDSCFSSVVKKVVLYEDDTTLYRRVVKKRKCTRSLCYFQTLISIL